MKTMIAWAVRTTSTPNSRKFLLISWSHCLRSYRPCLSPSQGHCERNSPHAVKNELDQPLLDNFGASDHNFLNFEIKTCCKVALGLWKIILPSGMHTSRGLPQELILDLLKKCLCIYGDIWIFATQTIHHFKHEPNSPLRTDALTNPLEMP